MQFIDIDSNDLKTLIIRWRLDSVRLGQLLGMQLSDGELQEILSTPTILLDPIQFGCVSLLLCINDELERVLNNSEDIYIWLNSYNSHKQFTNKTPLSYMSEVPLENLSGVFDIVESMSVRKQRVFLYSDVQVYVTVYAYAGIEYIRISELPFYIRIKFDTWMIENNSERPNPVTEKLNGCVYVGVFDEFISNNDIAVRDPHNITHSYPPAIF